MESSPLNHIAMDADGNADRFAGLAHLVTDAAPLLLSYIDSSLRYRFINRGYAEWFQRDVQDIIGKTALEVIGKAAYTQVAPYLAAALNGERIRYEATMPYETGGRRHVIIDLTPDHDTETGIVRGMVAVVSDITERRQAENSLAERERYLAALLDNSPDIISRFDADLRCQFTSAAAARALNAPADYFLGKTHREMGLPPEFYEPADAALRSVFATKQTVSISFTLPTITGPRFFEADGVPLFDVHGNVEAVMTVSRDVTDRNAAQAERAQLLERIADAARLQQIFLRDVLFSVSEGKFCLCDTPADLPHALVPVGPLVSLLGTRDLRNLRQAVTQAACERSFDTERVHDMVTASGEGAMNAVTHGGGGEAHICADDDGKIIQVWITDRGGGIGIDFLHRATLERGFTTAGTLGHGFWLMMKTADRLYLLTGESGTTLVLEQERTPPLPSWLQDAPRTG